MLAIQENVSLLPYNTFHFDCIARYFIEISKISELNELLKNSIFADNKRFILGGGANILLTSEVFDGLVIKNNILGKEILEDTDTYSIIKVGGGENRNDFVERSIDQGYHGLENLISIPGSVGAAPMQNIGAYGVEVGEYIESVSCKTLSPLVGKIQKNTKEVEPLKLGTRLNISKKQCAFGYRDSIFKQTLKNKVIITHVTFKLPKYHPQTYTPHIQYGAIQKKLSTILPPAKRENGKSVPPDKGVNISEHSEDILGGLSPHLIATTIAEIRASKLPNRHDIGTAGSFFKNPIIPETQFQELQKKFPELKGFPVNPREHIDMSQDNNFNISPGRSQGTSPSIARNVSQGKSQDKFQQDMACNIDQSIAQGNNDVSTNFIKLSAGQLIDMTGLKGLDQEHVGIYKKHALVLVHHGGGKGEEIVQLARHIQSQVQKKFGITIEPEVNFVR